MDKACPVLVRERDGRIDILAFRHPLAGTQLVKGTVEPGESPEAAAMREMFEESGVAVSIRQGLGSLDYDHLQQTWHMFACRSETELPERWTHRTDDDGGHAFDFFWQPLDERPDDSWHPDFIYAFDVIVRRLRAEDIA